MAAYTFSPYGTKLQEGNLSFPALEVWAFMRVMRGKKPPPGQCNQENDSDCCVQGKLYTTYTGSPLVSSQTKAHLTINSFEKGGDGGGPSECDNQYHSDNTLVVRSTINRMV
ncbi:hypothetical protein L1049_018246 [Liquidambar formosana]|uniref:Uncharacterized protein n=1 Tax=Liquidambar formosana TaxID=63359 RepID=A0AAP0R9U1_LIQFO